MKTHFEIIGGTVYLDKQLFADSLRHDNDLSKLMGSACTNIFATRPKVQTGIDTVTIDYSESDSVRINQDPVDYIRRLQEDYQNSVRGHLIMDAGDGDTIDLLINRY